MSALKLVLNHKGQFVWGEIMENWYVMQSKPNREFFLLSQLKLNNVNTYLPLVKTQVSSGRRRSRPFFPGYLFVQADLSERGTSYLQWIPGSKGIVMFGGQPPSVPDNFIEELKRKLNNQNIKQESKFNKLSEGNPVSIVHGPFEGYQAIFNEYLPEKDRVRLLLKTLADSSYFVEISAQDVTV